MKMIVPVVLIAMVIAGVVGVAFYWHQTSNTLSVQPYLFSISEQGLFTVAGVFYVLDGHELVVKMATESSSATINWVTSDASTWTTTSTVTVTQTVTSFEIPGWNCGYSDDNGRSETTQIDTSIGVFSITYYCIYPPTVTPVSFTGLVTAPWSNGQGTIVP